MGAKGRTIRLPNAKGKTLGIIGFGRIGQAVAKIAIGCGMKVLAHDKYTESATLHLDFFDGRSLDFDIHTTTMDQVLRNSDFVTLHVPAQQEYVIGAAEIDQMKEGAVFLNLARGPVVDIEALKKCIQKTCSGI